MEKGHISVIYKVMKDCVECSIEDNGIGRASAAKMSMPGRESHGTNIAFERIELFNKSTGFYSKYKIEDLYDDNHESLGTKVIFRVARTTT